MKVLMSGNEAIARGAYESGVAVACAYPGTPSTEVLENMVQYKDNIYAEWSPNEKVAMEVAIGAAVAGVRALVAMKHVGLNVAADPFMTVAYTGVRGGLVVVTADDPGMHSSQNEQDNRHYARFAKVPMLEPSDSQEAKDFIGIAFNISEQFDTPVLLRTTTRINHSKTVVELGERLKTDTAIEFQRQPSKYVMIPANAIRRHTEVECRLKRLEEYANIAEANRVELRSDELGIITSGISYQYVKEVFPEASVLKLGMTYPLPKCLIADFASKVKRLYVVEELDPFLEEQIKAMGIQVTGKDKLPLLGELNPSVLKEKLLGQSSKVDAINVAELPPRPPVLCPGCPHRGVFYILKKLKPVVIGDIGCYTLGVVPPLSALDSQLSMGASMGMTLGFERALQNHKKHKVVGVIGDSTFIHSGITGLIDIVYNKGASTIIILDNRTTGMTGHQHNPGTGITLMGETTRELSLYELCRTIGIEHVHIINPYDLEDTERVIKEELQRDEPSVIITNQPCVLIEKGRKRSSFEVDADKCKNCGACYRIGCPALFRNGSHTGIDSLLCIGCGICRQVCKFGAIQKAGDSL